MRRGGNKYGARKANCSQGHTHDSKREAARCDKLHQLEANGYITDLELQPRFVFVVNGIELKHDNGRRAAYTADFRYIDCVAAKRIVEDAKGFVARDWPLRKALFRACFPQFELREV
jgi:hypothetical protein